MISRRCIIASSRLLVIAFSLAACGVREDAVQRSQLHRFRIVHVVEGLDYAWGMAFLPNGDMLVTERGGTLRIIRGGVLDTQRVSGVPAVRATGQGGLLDVAIHPQFAANRLVYLSFSKPGPQGATTAVVRGRLDGHALVDVQDVFEAKAWTPGAGHFGSRLAFDRNGYLFISVGERQIMKDAQRLDTHQGKIIRLHDDGRVPKDNPFAGRADALPEIYALGIRNPHALVLIKESVSVPVLVDAGIGTASDAAVALELGMDGVLCNTAVALAEDPVAMAGALRHAVIAGRLAHRAVRMPARSFARASSPLEGVPETRFGRQGPASVLPGGRPAGGVRIES